MRISARLVNTSSRYQLWGNSYERNVRDSFLIQDEIAFNITKALPSKMGLPVASKVRTPQNPEAVRLYWTGQYIRHQARVDSMPRSAELFEQAVALDSSYADAWAALADVRAMMGYHGTAGKTVEEHVGLARSAAARALNLDRHNTEAYLALAQIAFFFDRNSDAAERQFRQALTLNPSYYKTRARYSFALASRGRFDDAIELCRTAMALDPLSTGINNDLGTLLYLSGRYGEAIAAAQQALRADPGFSPARALLGLCYSALGQVTQAIAEYRQAMAMSERFSYLVGWLGHDCARLGNRAEAEKLLKELTDAPDRSAVSYVHVAYVLAGLGDADRAIDALEKAVKRYDADVIYMGVDPGLDQLRAHPRFLRLLKTVGLPNLRAPR